MTPNEGRGAEHEVTSYSPCFARQFRNCFHRSRAREGYGRISKQEIRLSWIICNTAMGLSGKVIVDYYPMPRLAGTAAQIHRESLRAFIERRR